MSGQDSCLTYGHYIMADASWKNYFIRLYYLLDGEPKYIFSCNFRSSESHSPRDNRNLSSNFYYTRKFRVFQELASHDFRRSFLLLGFRRLWFSHCCKYRWHLKCSTSSCGKGRQDFMARLILHVCACALIKEVHSVQHYLTHTHVLLWNGTIMVWSDSLQQNLITCI